MGDSLQKAFFGIIALGVSCITIELVPVSRQAAYWNSCFENTVAWADESSEISNWDQKSKDSLAASAVYSPKECPAKYFASSNLILVELIFVPPILGAST